VYLITAQGWDAFSLALRRMPPQTFWLALGFMLLSRVSVTLRWFVLLRAAGIPMPLAQCLRLVFMGLFASNFLPTTVGGDLVRMGGAVALRYDPVVVAASLVLDRLVGMAGMSSLAPLGLWIVLQQGGGSAQVPLAASGVSGAAWVDGFKRRARGFAQNLLRSIALWLHKPSSLLLALLCTYGHMLFTFAVIALLLHGMGQPLNFWWIGGLWSLSYFITLAPVSINGLGVQEVSISLLYAHFGGVSTETGLALALWMRMLPMLASLPGALFLPEILSPRAKNQPGASQPSSTNTGGE
jgi:uncharacterized membrane protein YbhN (UPF0104 family)